MRVCFPKVLFLLLSVIIPLFAYVALLQERDDLSGRGERLNSRLNAWTECRRYGVGEQAGLLAISQLEPQVFLIISSSVAREYVELFRLGEDLPPHITILDTPLHEDDIKILLQTGVVCIPSISPEAAVRGLVNYVGSDIGTIGYLYGFTYRHVALYEMEQLESSGFSTAHRQFHEPLVQDEFAYGVGRFFTKDIVNYRFVGTEPSYSLLRDNASMRTFLERRAQTIIVDTLPFVELFPRSQVVLLGKNNDLIERFTTLLVLTQLHSAEKTPFSHPIRLYATAASLYDENIRNHPIAPSFQYLFTEMDRLFPQFSSEIADSAHLWEQLIQTVGIVLDTTAMTHQNPMILTQEQEMRESFHRMVDNPLYAAVISVLFLSGLIVFLVWFLIRMFNRRKYSQRTAFVIQGTANKAMLVGADCSMRLPALLDSEGYRMRLIQSLKDLQKELRCGLPNIIIADWNTARPLLQSLYQELGVNKISSSLTIVIMCVPEDKHIQLSKAFGTAQVNCYDEVSTLDDMQGHLRGELRSSSLAAGSYISGVIQGDNLTTILQMIEGNGNTGSLVVEDESPISALYFRSGRIVHADDRLGNSGISAIYNALNCRRGSFYFHLNHTPPSETLDLGTMEILMGWASKKDRVTQKMKAYVRPS